MDSHYLGRYAKAVSLDGDHERFGIIAGCDPSINLVYLQKVHLIADEEDYWLCRASTLVLLDETKLSQEEKEKILDLRRRLVFQLEPKVIHLDDLVHSVVEKWSSTQSDELSKLIMGGITALNQRLGGAKPSDVCVYLGDTVDSLLDLQRDLLQTLENQQS